MFDINDYYLGVIIGSPNYYNNKYTQKRLISNLYADPFFGLGKEQLLITGQVVILRKQHDTYYDEEYSIYQNELSYHLGKENRYGIILAYVKPFSDYFSEDVHIYNLKEIENDDCFFEKILFHSYYVMYTEEINNYSIITNDITYLERMRYGYLKDLLGPEEFDNLINQKYKKR